MDVDLRGTKDISVQILSSSLSEINIISTPLGTLLQKAVTNASNGISTRKIFKLTPNGQSCNTFSYILRAAQLPETSLKSIKDAQECCVTYINSPYKSEYPCVIIVRPDDPGYRDDKSTLRSILIVLSTVQDAANNDVSLSDQDGGGFQDSSNERIGSSFKRHLGSWAPWQNQWARRHQYETVTSSEAALPESRRSQLTRQLIRYGFISFIAITLLIVTLSIVRGHQDTMYDRYNTEGSEGPRHQLRIYWQNASDWAAANPQDSGKWKVRIDDQAIIPAELYDDDEDRYQSWYRNRYPEMQQVIDNYDYVRPSWMGSLKMKVPWDDQFHFAHCVLALRRYWKAKETGKHVCGRDIDYLHIDHCLGSLEKRVFIDGPRDFYDPPIYMYWQTKVCF